MGVTDPLDDPFAAMCPHGAVKNVHGHRTEVSCSCCGVWLGPPPAGPKCGECSGDVIDFPQAKPLGTPMGTLTIERDGQKIAELPNVVVESAELAVPGVAMNIRRTKVRPHPSDGPCACRCGCAARLELDPRLKGLTTGGRCWACDVARSQGRTAHGVREHKWDERADAQGLAVCVVCGGGEGSLPSECPGARMAPEVEDAVYACRKDFVNGRWHDDEAH